MLATAIDPKEAREKLKAKRDQLFARFAKNPQDIELSLEIKLLDDKIAQCTLQLNKKK